MLRDIQKSQVFENNKYYEKLEKDWICLIS
jgi:hypothetical protein